MILNFDECVASFLIYEGIWSKMFFGCFLSCSVLCLFVWHALSHTSLFLVCNIGHAVKVNSNLKVESDFRPKKEMVSNDEQFCMDDKDLNLTGDRSKDEKPSGRQAQTFTFEELAAATGNFRSACFLGEGGFGKVYKGHLERINQVFM